MMRSAKVSGTYQDLGRDCQPFEELVPPKPVWSTGPVTARTACVIGRS